METRELLLAGGDSGPAVVEGKPDESFLIELVSGANPDLVRPALGPRFIPSQVAIVRDWIRGGLPWRVEKLLLTRAVWIISN